MDAPRARSFFVKNLISLRQTEEAAEKVGEDTESTRQALKRRHIFNDLTARLKSCPSRNLFEAEFFGCVLVAALIARSACAVAAARSPL